MEIGFVGLGNMGGPMVVNLMGAGHRLIVHDICSSAVQQAVASGAVEANSPASVAGSAQIVLTSLPTPAVVEEVYLGGGGLLAGSRDGHLLVDLSSISPSLAKRIAEVSAEKGVAFLDAPVSGGVGGAVAATLAVMVGGDEDAYRRAEPVLKVIGSRVFRVGPSGTSSTIKILNQILVGINNAAVTEMLNLAKRSGMDLALVKEIISASSGWSRIFEVEFPRGVDRNFVPGFAVDLMAKDLRLARDLASELGAELQMTSSALAVFEKASDAGFGKDDVSVAIRLYEAVQA